MADTVTSQIILDGPRNLVMKFTNFSDGTGEIGVKKVDAQSTGFAVNGALPGIHLKVRQIFYDIRGMGVRLLWDATTPTDMVILGGFGMLDYRHFGGLPNPQGTGATGSILFTTIGALANADYNITLEMIKGV